MYGIQTLGIITALIMLYFAYLRFKRKEITNKAFGLWTLVWGGAILWLALSSRIKPVLEILEVGTMFDLTLAVGILTSVIIAYINYLDIAKQNMRIEQLVSALAIQNAEKCTHNGQDMCNEGYACDACPQNNQERQKTNVISEPSYVETQDKK